MINVAILGHGVVGSGVAEVLRRNAASIAHKAGQEIAIRRILDLREFPDLPYATRSCRIPKFSSWWRRWAGCILLTIS